MAAIHELADERDRLAGEVSSLTQSLQYAHANLETCSEELSLYRKLADSVAAVLETMNCLAADLCGDERFIRKLKGHFWSLEIDLIHAREGCSEEEAFAIWVEGRDAKVKQFSRQFPDKAQE